MDANVCGLAPFHSSLESRLTSLKAWWSQGSNPVRCISTLPTLTLSV